MSRILISTGDYSADLHGEALARELRKLDPSLQIFALGGIKLKSVADQFLQDMVKLDVSGLTQPIRQFFHLKNILQQIVFPKLDPAALDAVILIDYYGFNIHVAKKAKERNIPVFYFVSPQVWASRQWRIAKLRKNVTKMLVIFPFEEELYKKHGVPANFVGHPLMDRLPQTTNGSHPKMDAEKGEIHLGLMPGSRHRELVNHIPLMLGCFRELKKKFPKLKGTMFAVESITDEVYRSMVPPGEVEIVRDLDYKKRRGLTLSLTASGTATLENAILGIPMVVTYRASWLTFVVAKRLLRVPFISMPNILAGRAIVPELIQHHADIVSMTQTAYDLLSHPNRLEKMQNELIQLKKQLGQPGAYGRAAEAIFESLQSAKKNS